MAEGRQANLFFFFFFLTVPFLFFVCTDTAAMSATNAMPHQTALKHDTKRHPHDSSLAMPSLKSQPIIPTSGSFLYIGTII